MTDTAAPQIRRHAPRQDERPDGDDPEDKKPEGDKTRDERPDSDFDFLFDKHPPLSAEEIRRRKAFLQSLRNAYEGDLNVETLKHTSLFEDLYSRYGDASKDPRAGSPVVFLANRGSWTGPLTGGNFFNGNSVSVSKDTIIFKDGDKNFEFKDAMEMAKFAALDIDMRDADGGVTLEGSPKARALLQTAITELNESLPEGQKIKIKNPIEPQKDISKLRDSAKEDAESLKSAEYDRGQFKRKNNTNFRYDREAAKRQAEQDFGAEVPESERGKPAPDLNTAFVKSGDVDLNQRIAEEIRQRHAGKELSNADLVAHWNNLDENDQDSIVAAARTQRAREAKPAGQDGAHPG